MPPPSRRVMMLAAAALLLLLALCTDVAAVVVRDCGSPSTTMLAGGHWVCGADTLEGASCMATCPTGYYASIGGPSASLWAYCLATGWMYTGGDCIKKDCGALPIDSSNHVTSWGGPGCTDTRFGSTCTAVCAVGYEGAPITTCTAHGWSPAACTPVACTGAKTTDASVSGWDPACANVYGSPACTAVCAAGYEPDPLDLNNRVVIMGDGSIGINTSGVGGNTDPNFTSNLNTVITEGGGLPGGGNLSNNGTPGASRIDDGPRRAVCLANGQWAYYGSCVRKDCGPPTTGSSNHVASWGGQQCTDTKFGSICMGTCAPGYSGGLGAECTATGWDYTGAGCSPSPCDTEPSPVDGARPWSCLQDAGAGYLPAPHGTGCRTTCPGLVATPTVTCSLGEWSVPSTQCVASRCMVQPAFTQGLHEEWRCGLPAPPDSACQAACTQTDKYDGIALAACRDGTWRPVEGAGCLPRSCTGSPPQLEHAKPYDCATKTAHGGTCSTTCSDGFVAVGSLAGSCSYGSWEPAAGICQAIAPKIQDCPVKPLFVPPNGFFACSLPAALGETCKATCMGGSSERAMVATCNAAGWIVDDGACGDSTAMFFWAIVGEVNFRTLSPLQLHDIAVAIHEALGLPDTYPLANIKLQLLSATGAHRRSRSLLAAPITFLVGASFTHAPGLPDDAALAAVLGSQDGTEAIAAALAGTALARSLGADATVTLSDSTGSSKLQPVSMGCATSLRMAAPPAAVCLGQKTLTARFRLLAGGSATFAATVDGGNPCTVASSAKVAHTTIVTVACTSATPFGAGSHDIQLVATRTGVCASTKPVELHAIEQVVDTPTVQVSLAEALTAGCNTDAVARLAYTVMPAGGASLDGAEFAATASSVLSASCRVARTATSATTGTLKVVCSGPFQAGALVVPISVQLSVGTPGCNAGSKALSVSVPLAKCTTAVAYAAATSSASHCFKHVAPNTPINRCGSAPLDYSYANHGPGTAELRMSTSFTAPACGSYNNGGARVGSVQVSCTAAAPRDVRFIVTNPALNGYTARQFFLLCANPPNDRKCPSAVLWAPVPRKATVTTASGMTTTSFTVTLPTTDMPCSCSGVHWGWYEAGSFEQA